VAVALGYDLAFSDVSEAIAAIDKSPAGSPSRTGFTRIYQVGEGHTPDIAFAVAGRAAEAVHGLIDGVDGAPFDIRRWRASAWSQDDDLNDAFTKALGQVVGSERKAWQLVERDFRRTSSTLGKRPFRAATLEIASMLMRDGRVKAETIHRIAEKWGISRSQGFELREGQ
jgi:hypothetical protein